jgi:hypothetical protein
MISYELAKELKDAGFAQPNKSEPFYGSYITDQDEIFQPALSQKRFVEIAYIPTLEELIGACGDGFLQLHHSPFNPVMPVPPSSMPMTWQAMGGEFRGSHWSYQQSGFTPKVAVARLWLALNKPAV